MILTPLVVAASRKIKDDRAKKKEAREARLQRGSSQAVPSFQSMQANLVNDPSRSLLARTVSTQSAETEIRYETPADVWNNTYTSTRPHDGISGEHPAPRSNYSSQAQDIMESPVAEPQDNRDAHTPEIHMTSPVTSVRGSFAVTSPGAGLEEQPMDKWRHDITSTTAILSNEYLYHGHRFVRFSLKWIQRLSRNRCAILNIHRTHHP